jgi:hypothetical protein
MGAFVALLRAVNVGGTGKLPMSDLKDICEELGFAAIRTYIASGNVVFETDISAKAVTMDSTSSRQFARRLRLTPRAFWHQ